jgi:hypothetical protein
VFLATFLHVLVSSSPTSACVVRGIESHCLSFVIILGDRDVEREVIAISQAQQILSENVAKQHEDVATLSRAVQKAHTHVKRGNEQLQRATKTSVHCRFYVLLFLLSLSFTLLLMHWYN